MNFKTLALLGGAVLLAGCPGTTTDEPEPTPAPTGDTGPATPATPDPFEWHVVLTDGDGVDDATGGQLDGDTIATETVNSLDNYPDVVEWDFGLAQTEQEEIDGQGWFGEDRDGVLFGGQDICHTMVPDTTMTLTTVAEIPQITPGQNTLVDIDFPEANTPELTYVLYGVDSTDAELVCFRMGHQPAYFNGPGCVDFTNPAPM